MGAALSGGYSSQSSTDVLTKLINSLQQTNQQSNATTQGGTQTARTLLPGQSGLIGPTSSLLSEAMSNPGKFVAPGQNQAREQVNENYSGLADKLHSQFLSLGGGSSGKFGTSLVKGDLARRADLSKVDSEAATTASTIPFTAANLANQMLGLNFGSSTNTSGSTDTSGSATTTGTESESGTEKKSGSGWSLSGGIGPKG